VGQTALHLQSCSGVVVEKMLTPVQPNGLMLGQYRANSLCAYLLFRQIDTHPCNAAGATQAIGMCGRGVSWLRFCTNFHDGATELS